MNARDHFAADFCRQLDPLMRFMPATRAVIAQEALKLYWAKRWGSSDIREWWGGLSQHERLGLKRAPGWLKKHLDS